MTGSQVVVNANGKLGVTASSARLKEAIKPMDKASEAVHSFNQSRSATKRTSIQAASRSSA
jgi:hypothetical protein